MTAPMVDLDVLDTEIHRCRCCGLRTAEPGAHDACTDEVADWLDDDTARRRAER